MGRGELLGEPGTNSNNTEGQGVTRFLDMIEFFFQAWRNNTTRQARHYPFSILYFYRFNPKVNADGEALRLWWLHVDWMPQNIWDICLPSVNVRIESNIQPVVLIFKNAPPSKGHQQYTVLSILVADSPTPRIHCIVITRDSKSASTPLSRARAHSGI
jgi:hypothetical protein